MNAKRCYIILQNEQSSKSYRWEIILPTTLQKILDRIYQKLRIEEKIFLVFHKGQQILGDFVFKETLAGETIGLQFKEVKLEQSISNNNAFDPSEGQNLASLPQLELLRRRVHGFNINSEHSWYGIQLNLNKINRIIKNQESSIGSSNMEHHQGSLTN